MKRLGIRLIKAKKNDLVFYFEFSEIIDFKNGKLQDLDGKMNEQYNSRTNNEKLIVENYEKVTLLLDSFDDIKNEELKCSILKSIDDWGVINFAGAFQFVISVGVGDFFGHHYVLD